MHCEYLCNKDQTSNFYFLTVQPVAEIGAQIRAETTGGNIWAYDYYDDHDI